MVSHIHTVAQYRCKPDIDALIKDFGNKKAMVQVSLSVCEVRHKYSQHVIIAEIFDWFLLYRNNGLKSK